MSNSQEETTPLLSERSRRSSVPSLVDNSNLEAVQAELDNKSHEVVDKSSWRTELWLLFAYAVPLIGTYLLQYFYTVVTVFVAGHLGPSTLAAAAIGQTTFNITAGTLYEGMATALDTLCSQAYGSGNIKGVGLHMQRMICFMAVVSVPLGALWLCSPWLFPYIVQQPDLAVAAGRFLQISLIGLPGYASFEVGKRFLQAQGNFTVSLVVLMICAPVNIFLNWLFAFKLGWGLNGAALAQGLTNGLRPILLLLYVLTLGKWSLQCWGGFSSDAFKKWGPMVRLSFSCAAVNLAEWGATEISTFSCSWVSTDHLAAQTILINLSIIMWHIPFSVGVAISTRIGHLVGAGQLRTLRRVTAFYSVVFLLIGLFDMTFIYLFRDPLVRTFSEDVEVRKIASSAIKVVAIFQVADALLCGCNGTLRGLGRPEIGGWTVFFVNYFAAVPLALWLTLGKPGMGVAGLWTGLLCGMVANVLIETVIMKFMSWQKCIDVTRSREVPD